MKKIKVLLIYLLIVIFAITSMSACAKKQEKPAPESESEPKSMPPVVDEIESEIISIMSEVDMIPYYKKQIEKKLMKEKEKIDLAEKLGAASSESGNQDAGQGGQESKEKKETSQIDTLIKFEASPLTINDILLSEVLKVEATEKKENGSQEIPNDIAFIWHGINTKITGLHKKWNMLESHVVKSGAPQESIKGFENTLNNLTISASQYNFLDTLFHSNKLTSYIPDLINNFKKKVPSPVYFMKYHLRQIILDCRINDYESAAKNYNKLIIYKDSLVSQLIDKKLTEPANKLNTSVKDLEDALKLKDLNIIKIKAAVVMSNIETVKEELSK